VVVASDSHLEGRALILGVHQTGSTPCLNNAVAESFFAALKVELVDRQHHRTRAEARASISAAVEGV
jgi:hypothetical protein